MKISFLVLATIFLFSSTLKAQFNQTSFGGATYISIASGGNALSGLDALYSNKAGIIDVNNWGLDLSADRKFNLNALSSIALGCVKNTSLGHFALVAQKFGLEEYSQQKFGFIYARKLLPQLNVAAQFNYHNISIEEFGSTDIFNFEVGMLAQLSRDISLGINIESPLSKEINEEHKLQSKISIGMLYKLSNVSLLVDIEKNTDFDPEFSIASLYQVNELFEARMGYNITSSNFGFGFGINLNSINARAGYSLNNILGNTPSLSIQYKD